MASSSEQRSLVAGAARRLALLAGGAGALTAAVALPIGLATGAAPLRALSVGFYVGGCLAVVLGFALGLHRVGAHDRGEAITDSALFVVLGVVLLALGVLTDTRYPLL